mgnify:CR=1 FL=1
MAKNKINPIVASKIKHFIVQRMCAQPRLLDGNFGSYSKECQYEFVYNEMLPQYIFARYRKLRFHNKSLDSNKISVLAFNANTGEFIPEFLETEDNYAGFFEQLKFIDKII